MLIKLPASVWMILIAILISTCSKKGYNEYKDDEILNRLTGIEEHLGMRSPVGEVKESHKDRFHAQ